MRKPITMERLVAAHDRIMDKVYSDLAGGTQYGVDYPTLVALFPARAIALKRIRAIAKSVFPLVAKKQ